MEPGNCCGKMRNDTGATSGIVYIAIGWNPDQQQRCYKRPVTFITSCKLIRCGAWTNPLACARYAPIQIRDLVC